jgi:hypothetical protein
MLLQSQSLLIIIWSFWLFLWLFHNFLVNCSKNIWQPWRLHKEGFLAGWLVESTEDWQPPQDFSGSCNRRKSFKVKPTSFLTASVFNGRLRLPEFFFTFLMPRDRDARGGGDPWTKLSFLNELSNNLCDHISVTNNFLMVKEIKILPPVHCLNKIVF